MSNYTVSQKSATSENRLILGKDMDNIPSGSFLRHSVEKKKKVADTFILSL